MSISSQLMAYLKSWYETSTGKQRKAGVEVALTFEEFLALFDVRQIRSLEKAIETNRIRYQQDEGNQFAYVLTWQSYAARSTNVMSKDTAIVCSRMKSSTINLPQQGDKLRPSHCQNISKSLTGRSIEQAHKDNISMALKGKPKTQWTEERKAARRALIAAKKENKK